jgi:hypothetical protein
MADRTDLLPPMLESNPLWVEFAQAIETVWANIGIPQAISQLKTLRQPMVVSDLVISNALSEGKLININDTAIVERDTLVQTADLLGFRFYASNTLTDANFLMLCNQLAYYYNQGKGQMQWTDFLSFCLGTPFSVSNTWTNDYVTFYAEGDPRIGKPIYDGGTWYPTTHIIVNLDQTRFLGVDTRTLVDLIEYFDNIQLVIHLISITDSSEINEFLGLASTTTVTY